jgi:hypothetical protein
MRNPDIHTHFGTDIWRVPIDRVAEWVRTHPERVHQASRGHLFAQTWRDLYYLRVSLSGGDIDDNPAQHGWIALSLRDIRSMPRYPRVYQEAEWELFAEAIKREEPPVNGDGLYDSLDMPLLIYQFHGLPETRIMDLGDGNTFAVYALELLARGPGRSDADMAFMLSTMVNAVRAMDGSRPLRIGIGNPVGAEDGPMDMSACLLAETEDGAMTTVAK